MADGVELTGVTKNGQPADNSGRAIERAPLQTSRDPDRSTITTKTNATGPPGLCALMILCFCPMRDTDHEPEEVKSPFRTPKKGEVLPAVPDIETQENLGPKSRPPTTSTKCIFI